MSWIENSPIKFDVHFGCLLVQNARHNDAARIADLDSTLPNRMDYSIISDTFIKPFVHGSTMAAT
jgi:hypothetical protein